jgi:hypothetical protein
VTRRYLPFAVISCCLALHAHPACGCRYNVREVGFIDVGVDPYRLFVYLPESTSQDQAASLKEAADLALADCNVRCELLIAGADANHPAMEFLASHGIRGVPAAVLVSPDGQSMPLSLASAEGSLAQAVSSCLERVLRSPARERILDKAVDSYGVVLLMEGPEEQRNMEVREAISTAIGRIGGQLGSLPKPIARPPELVTLDRQSLAGEEILLWSLGLKPQDINEPHVAVFYGRGRWIGPLFKGDVLTQDHLTQLLLVVGADCECGLDHRFLQGTMLPARWDEKLQQKASASLGFDPESPMVRAEMVSIVRRGMGGFDSPVTPLDYREIQVGSEAAEDGGQKTEDEGQTTGDGASTTRVGFSILAVSLGGMAVFVAAISGVIVLRARRA